MRPSSCTQRTRLPLPRALWTPPPPSACRARCCSRRRREAVPSAWQVPQSTGRWDVHSVCRDCELLRCGATLRSQECRVMVGARAGRIYRTMVNVYFVDQVRCHAALPRCMGYIEDTTTRPARPAQPTRVRAHTIIVAAQARGQEPGTITEPRAVPSAPSAAAARTARADRRPSPGSGSSQSGEMTDSRGHAGCAPLCVLSLVSLPAPGH